MDIKKTMEDVGKTLPDTMRSPGSSKLRVHMEPQGTIKVSNVVDVFETGKTDRTRNNLEGKEVVLFFGSENHGLTRMFQRPKLQMIHHFLSKERPDVEIVYVSMDKSKQEFDRFTQTHPWAYIPFDEIELREALIAEFYTPLKKPHGACAIVIISKDGDIISQDSEPGLTKTHDEQGKDYPWKTTTAENCCAAGATIFFCAIM